jgi:hypothetical protein
MAKISGKDRKKLLKFPAFLHSLLQAVYRKGVPKTMQMWSF